MDKDRFSYLCSSNVLKGDIKRQSYMLRTFPHFLHSQLMKRKSSPAKCSYSKILQVRNLFSLFSFPTIYAKEINASHHIESQTPEYLKISAITDEDVENYLAAETGYMRLHEMFSKDNKGNFSEEVMFIKDVTEKTFILGGIAMSVFGAKESREKHLQQTKAVAFRTHMEAARVMSDRTWIGAVKTGAKWGLRTAAFTFCFLSISQTIAVYRNKSSPLEYTIGSAITGALMKTNLGIRGMIGGGFLGTLIGVVAGLCIYGGLRLGNDTQEQRHYQQIVRKLEMSRNPSQVVEELKSSQLVDNSVG